MVYGIAKMLNFAHGDVIMIGAYTIFATVSMAGLPPVLGILLSVVLCTLLGIAIEAIAYRPLRQASSSLVVLITAIGVSYFLQNIALLIFLERIPRHSLLLLTFQAFPLREDRLPLVEKPS